MQFKSLIMSLACSGAVALQNADAASGTISVSGLSGDRLIVVDNTGATESATITNGRAKVTIAGSSARLYEQDGGQISRAILAKSCKVKGKNLTACSSSRVLTKFKKGSALKVKSGGTGVLLATLKTVAAYKKTVVTSSTGSKSAIVAGVSSHGLAALSTSNLRLGIRAASDDADADGLVNALDSDDDGDAVLDNYDTDATAAPASNTTFKLFSNLKLGIEGSLNLQANGAAFTQTRIDAALEGTQSLAIQIAGTSGDTVELDCGTLGYCSSGGTGTANNAAFPGTAGGATDSDSDGLGTLTAGPTGDFQLQTHATSSQIGAGDTYIQRVTDSSGKETEVPGMLNFVFVSTPALKSVVVGATTTTIDYTANPIAGGPQNCIAAPASGDVSVSITGWRPQRPGVSSAGEGTYVDLGNSLITIDIPNAPCTLSGGGGCPGSGPGNCSQASYSETDTNLAVGSNGITDSRGDIDSAADNTYTFTVNVSTCLGSTAWDAGKTVFLDLQFRSPDGDNAAQKFCVTRAAS